MKSEKFLDKNGLTALLPMLIHVKRTAGVVLDFQLLDK